MSLSILADTFRRIEQLAYASASDSRGLNVKRINTAEGRQPKPMGSDDWGREGNQQYTLTAVLQYTAAMRDNLATMQDGIDAARRLLLELEATACDHTTGGAK